MGNQYYKMPDFDGVYAIQLTERKTIEQQQDERYRKAAQSHEEFVNRLMEAKIKEWKERQFKVTDNGNGTVNIKTAFGEWQNVPQSMVSAIHAFEIEGKPVGVQTMFPGMRYQK